MLHSTLSAEELDRANRYHFEKDRRCFIIAHGMLRKLVAMYTNIQPQSVNFCYNPYGKPQLNIDNSDKKLNFNLSHSGDMVVFAFTQDIEVGVDVEQVREDIEFLELASHIFSDIENNKLLVLPHIRKCDAFFRCWTRKEAYIKAHGMGLSMPLKGFDVKLDGAEQPILLASRHDHSAVFRWSIHDLNLTSGYIGALAIKRPRCTIKYCEYS